MSPKNTVYNKYITMKMVDSGVRLIEEKSSLKAPLNGKFRAEFYWILKPT